MQRRAAIRFAPRRSPPPSRPAAWAASAAPPAEGRVNRGALILFLAALAATSMLPAPAVARGHRVGKRVFVVGDSLAVGTRPYLGRALSGWRVRTSASISKQAPQGAAELMRRRRHLPPVVVASLGTNGDPHAVGSFESSVRKARHAVGT